MSAFASVNRDLWSDALGRLEGRLSPQNYDMWLRPLECVSCDRGIVRLRAPNSYVRLWFESNFLDTVLSELRAASGDEYSIEFDPDGPEAVPRQPPVDVDAAPPAPGGPVGLASGRAAGATVAVPNQERPHRAVCGGGNGGAF